MKKDLLSISDLEMREILELLDLAQKVKSAKADYYDALRGKTIGLIFQKPSNRTRVSFEIGMVQLGGYAIYLGPHELEMGKREAVKDIASVLSRYLDGIVTRTYLHEEAKELARYASVPVINGLSDMAHPCQALADIYTIREKKGTFKKIKLAYVGDGNNVLNSLLIASAKVGLDITVATPKGYEPAKKIAGMAMEFSAKSGSKVKFYRKAEEAVSQADIVYTDVWVSMGHEGETKKRLKRFKGFQVNERLMKSAKRDCLIMHCLPAHRGQEITNGVIDSPNSIVYDQAENRMHVEKAILLKLLGER